MGINLIPILASAALVASGSVAATQTRAFDALPMVALASGAGAAGETCGVNVDRSGAAGTAQVTRGVNAAGNCVCNVLTGPGNANGAAENVVNSVLQSRSCADAPPANTVGEQVSTAATGGGGSGAILPVVLGAVGAAGLAVALGSQSNG